MIDLDALWKILVVALVIGVGLTALFGEGVAALERARRGSAVAGNAVVVALVAAACLAALAAGLIAMTHK
jgi:hypothetical protein